jgi:hypothetical protein
VEQQERPNHLQSSVWNLHLFSSKTDLDLIHEGKDRHRLHVVSVHHFDRRHSNANNNNNNNNPLHTQTTDLLFHRQHRLEQVNQNMQSNVSPNNEEYHSIQLAT